MKLKIKILLLIFFILISCKKNEDKSKKLLKSDLKAVKTNSIILNGVKFTNTKRGIIVWEINANNAKVDKNSNVAYLNKVFINFFARNIKATSNKGKYFLKSKNGELFDNVTIFSKLWKINTNEAFLNNNDKTVVLNSWFKFYGKNFYVEGEKLKIFIEEKQFKINGRVKTIWREK